MSACRPLILCIDDEAVGLHVRRILLERAGYRVVTAQDGPSGLEAFAREPVDLVVLDYSMPGMNGDAVARRMREIRPEVPIVLLSAYLELPPQAVGLVDAATTKGAAPAELLGHLEGLLVRIGYAQPTL